MYSLGPSDRTPESKARAEQIAQRIAWPTKRRENRSSLSPIPGKSLSTPERFLADAAKHFRLSSVEGSVATQKREMAESWKSQLLRYETDLRELVADGNNCLPSFDRIAKVISLYDNIVRIAETQSEYLAEFLRLFRIEFCRGIFSKQDIGLGEEDPGKFATFFDQVNALMRQNALLTEEIVSGNTKERVAELTSENEMLSETINIYKNEIERLTRQKEQALDQLRKMGSSLEEVQQQLENQTQKSEREIQGLNVENKEMQLQIFRLRKQVSGGRAKVLKDAYSQMKLTKISMMTTLFSEGDERISLLVFLNQLESRLNEVLDSYDNEFILSSDTMHVEIRRKMGRSAAVILEEMHLCEQNYRRLVPRNSDAIISETVDETDCFVGLLFDPKIYERLLSRESIRKRLELVVHDSDFGKAPTSSYQRDGKHGEEVGKLLGNDSGRGGKGEKVSTGGKEGGEPAGASNPFSGGKAASEKVKTLHPITSAQAEKNNSRKFLKNDDDLTLEELVFKKKEEWIESIFSVSSNRIVLTHYGLKVGVERQQEGIIPAELLMPRLLRRPLLDFSSKKFLSGVEIFSGTSSTSQKFLCAVNSIDPSNPIQIPEFTNYIKLKYKNSLREAGIDVVNEREALRVNSSSLKTGEDVAPHRIRSSDGRYGGAVGNAAAKKAVGEWGTRSVFKDEEAENQKNPENQVLFSENENLRVFRELQNPSLFHSHNWKQQQSGAMSSTTAITVAFQRLNPLAPNRPPEWSLYKELFGGYRSFTPRMLEVSTIDHIILCSCERHFKRMEDRFEYCLGEANRRATTNQLSLTMAERFFRESYELTDFQESLIDELENRYVYPELVAKTLYELLCYLDAVSSKDKLMSLYLDVIRGFEPPTHIHYMCFLLYHLSYSWPSSHPLEEIQRKDVRTVLRFLYRSTERIFCVDIAATLSEFDMASRSPLTLTAMRTFLGTAAQHQEEPILLYLNNVFVKNTQEAGQGGTAFDAYANAIMRNWDGYFDEKRNLVRFLSAGLGLNKGPLLSSKDLAFVAASTWCSQLWY